MRKCRMIFSDIDGTLLNSSHQITEKTKRKIKELDKIGIPFVLVSARMPDGIFPIQEELDIKAPLVCYSGGLILNRDRHPIQSIGISRNKAIAIKDYIDTAWEGVCCTTYSYNQWIVDDDRNPWVIQEREITKVMPQVGLLPEVLTEGQEVHKILCMGEPEKIQEMGDALAEKYPELSVYKSKDTYLEIMDGSALKSHAVKILCETKKIPIADTVSFGDNYNDVDMLMATGMGIAMGNAPEGVKKQVKHVTLDNDHEGVLAILNQLSY